MKYCIFIIIVIVSLSCNSKRTKNEINYPLTPKVDTVSTYFGTKVSDPYRWLEDENSAMTTNWIKKENTITSDFLADIPYREKIRNRLKAIWNYSKISTPFKKGAYTFFLKNDGLQNQSILYFSKNNGTPRVLIDPNLLSKDGTVAISSPTPSQTGIFLAYQISNAGSDWTEIVIKDVETGISLSDTLKWVKFSSISWKGNEGFYYSHFDIPEKGKEFSQKNEFGKVYFHKLGNSQSKDSLIYQDLKNPSRSFNAFLTDDSRFLIIEGTESTSGNSLLIKDLLIKNSKFNFISSDFKNNYSVITNIDDKLLILTDKNAPNYQLVLIDPLKPDFQNWKLILPETSSLLQTVNYSHNRIIAKYLYNVSSKISIFNIDGIKSGDINLREKSIVDEINSDIHDSILFYSTVNFISPLTIYKFNLNSGVSSIYFKPQIAFNSDEYETNQLFYKSKDGSTIPMFITYKKGILKNGKNPCFLYGYGGFNISNTPRFNISNFIFLEQGGIYAVANIRGGGEFGENWHKAGTKCNKQNVFDDFISAADFLVNENYTSHNLLAIHGRSNGGLLIGATITQRPDLAKVAVPGVGVLDMLRYHKFTIGYTWATDYGTSENEEEFKCLIKYSPLHNIKDINYPATLIMTGDHDDRVVPAHSFKFAATLQEKNKGYNPILIRIDSNAGHGAGKPTNKMIDEQTDMWSFIFKNLGIQPVY